MTPPRARDDASLRALMVQSLGAREVAREAARGRGLDARRGFTDEAVAAAGRCGFQHGGRSRAAVVFLLTRAERTGATDSEITRAYPVSGMQPPPKLRAGAWLW